LAPEGEKSINKTTRSIGLNSSYKKRLKKALRKKEKEMK